MTYQKKLAFKVLSSQRLRKNWYIPEPPMFIVSAGSQSQQKYQQIYNTRKKNLNEGLLLLTGPRVAVVLQNVLIVPQNL